jgi:hypothetical protein
MNPEVQLSFQTPKALGEVLLHLHDLVCHVADGGRSQARPFISHLRLTGVTRIAKAHPASRMNSSVAGARLFPFARVAP